ncbi:MAG TPA: HlyD family efflux transporter periplasmic adaptor subunit [Fimbriiglobus sp.]|jgi:multidrug resistance efflux pump
MTGENRKFPGLFGWFALLLLGGSIYLTWWLTRPTTGAGETTVAAEDIEVACTGRVDSFERPIGLEPEVAGKVVKIYVGDVAPNNVVRKGDNILEIDPTYYKIKVDEAQLAVGGARIEVEKADADAAMFPIQLAARKQSLAAAEANVANAEIIIQVFEESEKATRKEGDKPSLIYQLRLKALEESLKGLKALAEVEKKRVEIQEKNMPKYSELTIRAARGKFQAAGAAIDEATKALDNCTLKAPGDGTILQMNVGVGGIISPGTPALIPNIVFAPAGPLVVRADLEQEYVGRVAPGMKVELRDEARATSPLWTGQVVTISEYIAQKRNVILDPGENNDVRTAECVISIDPSKDKLRIGQRMRVRIQTRSR